MNTGTPQEGFLSSTHHSPFTDDFFTSLKEKRNILKFVDNNTVNRRIIIGDETPYKSEVATEMAMITISPSRPRNRLWAWERRGELIGSWSPVSPEHHPRSETSTAASPVMVTPMQWIVRKQLSLNDKQLQRHKRACSTHFSKTCSNLCPLTESIVVWNLGHLDWVTAFIQ